MNTENIEKIAKEYAEYYVNGRPCYLVDNIVKKETVKGSVKDFLTWLFERYCIVDKEVVMKEFENTFPADIDRDLISCSRERMLRELFSDIF